MCTKSVPGGYIETCTSNKQHKWHIMATEPPAKRAKMLPIPVNLGTSESSSASSEVVLQNKSYKDHMAMVKNTQNYSYTVPAGTLPFPPDELLLWFDEISKDHSFGVVSVCVCVSVCVSVCLCLSHWQLSLFQLF